MKEKKNKLSVQLSLDLVRDWLAQNLEKSLLDKEKVDLGIGGLVTYQRFDGLMDLKIVSSCIAFLIFIVLIVEFEQWVF